MSLDLFARVFGAVAPVVAVVGTMVVNKVTDPPEMPKEYITRVEIFRGACREVADYILSPLYEVEDAVERFLADRISKEELSYTIARAADSIEADIRNLPGIPPIAVDIVKKVYSPDLVKIVVEGLRSLAEFVRVHYSPTDIYSYAKSAVNIWKTTS